MKFQDLTLRHRPSWLHGLYTLCKQRYTQVWLSELRHLTNLNRVSINDKAQDQIWSFPWILDSFYQVFFHKRPSNSRLAKFTASSIISTWKAINEGTSIHRVFFSLFCLFSIVKQMSIKELLANINVDIETNFFVWNIFVILIVKF